MKRLFAATTVALVGLAGMSASPAAADPDGSKTYLVLLYGDDGSSQTPTELFLGEDFTTAEVSAYVDGPPAGYVSSSVPADPAWFNLGETITFRMAYTNSSGQALLQPASVLYTFGSSWSDERYASQRRNPTRTVSGSEETEVYATRCSVDWNPEPPSGGTDQKPNCPGDEYETVLIFGTAPEPTPGNGDGTSASGAEVRPAAHIQEFPKSSSMTCDEAQPEGLNWSGVPSGGWSESWAQWPNEGNGGEVCVRTVFYNNSTSKWDIR